MIDWIGQEGMQHKRTRTQAMTYVPPVSIPVGSVILQGHLTIPQDAHALVIFMHASGSSQRSPRNRLIAAQLHSHGIATLLFDLLSPSEEIIDLRTHRLNFDVALLARRTIATLDWLAEQEETHCCTVGFFCAGTAAAAAMIAAAERPQKVGAMVARSSRPDLAASAIPHVRAPILLLASQHDDLVIERNRHAMAQIRPDVPKRLIVVPNASYGLTDEEGWKIVAKTSLQWLTHYLKVRIQ